MKNKKTPSPLSSEKKKLIRKIHTWAYTDPKKNPKKFSERFNEIWKNQFENER